jgi:hypothetical protein
VSYLLGRAWGSRRIHRFVARHGRWVLLDVDDVTRADAWLRRHQRRATFSERGEPMEFEPSEINRRQDRQLFLALITLCGFFLAVGGALGSRPPVGNALKLGDLSEAHIVEIRDDDGRTILSGEFRTRMDPLGNIERDAALTDRSGTNVIGEVEVEIPGANASDRRQELEIDIIKLAPRATFTVVIDDRPVTSFVTDDRGSIDLEIESAPHDSSQVPASAIRQHQPEQPFLSPRGTPHRASAGRRETPAGSRRYKHRGP